MIARASVVLCVVRALATAAPQAPAAFVAAMKPSACSTLTWTRISEDTWSAYCVVIAKDPEAREVELRDHSVVVFHHIANAPTFDKLVLFTGESQKALRTSDDDPRVAVATKGTRVTIKSNGFTGETHVQTWDLRAFPPQLKTYTAGAARAWSRDAAPVSNTCTYDLEHHRDRCELELPSCGAAPSEPAMDESWAGEKVTFRSVPVLASIPGPPSPPADPFTCAAVFGDDATDVYFGKNSRHTTFQAVGDDQIDNKHKHVVLYLRAQDATLARATKADAWQNADHWELWLSPAGDGNVEWRDRKADYCAARGQFVQIILAPHEDGSIEIVNGAPKAKGSIAGATAKLRPDGAVVVDLDGTLALWAANGALTVAYSDSVDGKKQDTLIGSSRVKWGKPETFGRLGRDVLCRAGITAKPDALPWK